MAQKLIDAFWPGPLTLLLPKSTEIPSIVTSGLDLVGVRCPRHPLALALLESLDAPLAAPSANRFGRISPTTATHVLEELGNEIPYVLDGGSCDVGVESTVLKIDGNNLIILRQGGLSLEDLQNVVGRIVSISSLSGPSASPGSLESHYAPSKQMFSTTEAFLAKAISNVTPGETAILLPHAVSPVSLGLIKSHVSDDQIFFLTSDDDDLTAARSLFDMLRLLDHSHYALILAMLPVYTNGLWPAITDRLTRASLKSLD
jgi:L-threonylcarbamoyladenylate synthase